MEPREFQSSSFFKLPSILICSRTFGRIVPAHFGDIYGVFNIMIIFTAFAGIISLTIWLTASENAPIIVFAALYGLASGCTLSIIPAMVATLSDVRKLGTRNGALYAFTSVGVLVGSPIAGAIVNAQNGGFSGLKIFCGITIIVGAVFAVASRATQVGFRVKVKI
jgi:MFS family permease